MHADRSTTLPLLVGLVAVLVASPALGRSVDAQRGSAIEPAFSLRHDVLHPGDDVTLQACVTNQNVKSTRDIQPGDRLVFTFQDGIVGACTEVTAFPDGGPSSSDFACATSPTELTLTYTGPAVAWRHGSGVCANIEYHVGTRTSSVLTQRIVGNEGAFTGPEPTAILLTVDAALQAVGPAGPQGESGATGPVGPAGPAGAAGASAVGARLMAVSSGCVRAHNCDPPVLVPGLVVTLASSPGSSAAVWVDVVAHPLGCGSVTSNFDTEGELQLEFDGVIVARRPIEVPFVTGGSVSGRSVGLAWLSDPLAAGTHDVRVLVADTNCPDVFGPSETAAIGSDTDDERQARLIVMELRN